LFLSFLDHPDMTTRRCALDIVSVPGLFPVTYVEQIAHHLRERVNLESDNSTKATAIKRLGEFVWVNKAVLGDTLDDYADLFHILWQSTEEKPIPFVTALSLVKMLEDKSPDRVVDFLIEAIVHPQDVGWGYSGGLTAISTLWHLGFERSLLAVEEALRLMKTPGHAKRLTKEFLEKVFGELIRGGISSAPGPNNTRITTYPKAESLRPIMSLTNEQRQAVCVIVEADIVWEEPHNLLEAFGLPADRDEIRKLLG
jgi:hypothetical protein